MLISVNIPDELAAQALAKGLTPESYIEELLSERMSSATDPALADKMADLERFFVEIAAHSDKFPVPSDEVFSRESFYTDHD